MHARSYSYGSHETRSNDERVRRRRKRPLMSIADRRRRRVSTLLPAGKARLETVFQTRRDFRAPSRNNRAKLNLASTDRRASSRPRPLERGSLFTVRRLLLVYLR